MGRRRQTGDGAAKAAPSTLSHAEQLSSARETSLRLLTVRERTRAELRTRLRQKGFAPEVIEAVLDRHAEAGLLDDGRFAELYAAEAAARGKAARLIQGELRGRGVAPELAAAAAATRPEDDEARAMALASARAARMTSLTPEQRARRLGGLLARRGFDPDTCRHVVETVLGSAGAADGGLP